jgi:hypothetical protein
LTSSPSLAEDHRLAFAGQITAAVGAALALLGPFSEVISGIGIAVLILGVILSAPAGNHPGPLMVDWWSVLAIGALAALIGFGLGFWLPAVGGIVLAAGSVAALAAVFFGAPVESE